MHELLKNQIDLQQEATALLEETLTPILCTYGEVFVGGSYTYNLLSHPDIDVDVVSKNISREIYIELCKKLLSMSTVSKLKSADRVAFPHHPSENRPHGYWVSPTIHFGENMWTIDIWLQKPEWFSGDTSKYKEELLGLDDEQRVVVLSLKEDLRRKDLYGIGKKYTSVDVYESVLRGKEILF